MAVVLMVIADLLGLLVALAVLLELITQAAMPKDSRSLPGQHDAPLPRPGVRVLGMLFALGAIVGPVVSKHMTIANQWVSPERPLLYALVAVAFVSADRVFPRPGSPRTEEPSPASVGFRDLQQALTNLLPSFDRYESLCIELERGSERGEPVATAAVGTLQDELNAIRGLVAESVVDIDLFRAQRHSGE
ncbi:MAG: hypothetical protein OXI33_00770 [Chloroflexota bacterium]|nr:hypothetical protein [Chloroflexota bacterium]